MTTSSSLDGTPEELLLEALGGGVGSAPAAERRRKGRRDGVRRQLETRKGDLKERILPFFA